jgi:transposase-like protein
MRYPASEKLEIIRLVEQSHLPARRTLQTLGILPSTFYRWYDRYQTGGPEALEDRPSRPNRVWNVRACRGTRAHRQLPGYDPA